MTFIRGTQIRFDSSAKNTANSANTVSVSHTLGAGPRRMVLAIIGVESFTTAVAPTSVTYGGVSMTQVAALQHTDGTAWVGIYYLGEASLPGAGSNTVQANWSGSHAGLSIIAASFSNVWQEAPPDSNTSQASSYTAISTSLTPTSHRSVAVDGFHCGDNNAHTPDSGQTSMQEGQGGSSDRSGASYKKVNGGSSISMGWTASSSNRGVHAIAVIREHAPGCIA